MHVVKPPRMNVCILDIMAKPLKRVGVIQFLRSSVSLRDAGVDSPPAVREPGSCTHVLSVPNSDARKAGVNEAGGKVGPPQKSTRQRPNKQCIIATIVTISTSPRLMSQIET